MEQTPNWEQIGVGQPRTAHEYVQETLRRAILTGELPTGSRLVQSELAEQLAVSTTPVREALRNLTTEGLVVFDAHRGAIVRQLSKRELDELVEIRFALEPLAVRLAMERIDDETIQRAEEIHERMLVVDRFGEWLELNREFHKLHHDAAEAPRLQSILVGLQNASAMYVGKAAKLHPEIRSQGEADHAAINQAFRDRDVEAAVEVLLRHIRLPIDLLTSEMFVSD